jgi:hypothetical protein
MSVQENIPAPVPYKNAYGKVIREKGTVKLIVGFAVVLSAWFAYNSVHANLMNQMKWPALSSEPSGLTVLALRDVNRPGWNRKYRALEVNHAWQVRRSDDDEPSEGGPKEEETPESKDRGAASPGAVHQAAHGEVVDVPELMANCPTVLTGKHFTGASISKGYEPFINKNFWTIHLSLSEEGSSRYWQFSREHDGERLAFVLKYEISSCPKISHMDVSNLELGPVWIKADAEKLVEFINGQKK